MKTRYSDSPKWRSLYLSSCAVGLRLAVAMAATIVAPVCALAATPTRSTSNLPQTGITAEQCYGAVSNALISCSSTAAIGLSAFPKQDGMYTDVNPESYTRVGVYPITACVKDRITGLIWEGKPPTGRRSSSRHFTNYQNGSASDASGYVRGVNAGALCGYTDWRLPTARELETIVNAGTKSGTAAIDAFWFPNSGVSAYWSSTIFSGDLFSYWYIDFSEGDSNVIAPVYATSVRLVRSDYTPE